MTGISSRRLLRWIQATGVTAALGWRGRCPTAKTYVDQTGSVFRSRKRLKVLIKGSAQRIERANRPINRPVATRGVRC